MNASRDYLPKRRLGMVLLALAMIALGVGLAAGAFALSAALGAATSVVAIGPIVLAGRLLWEASRGHRRTLAIAFVGVIGLATLGGLSLPYWEHWDLTGEAWVTHAEPMPAEAEGTFDPPSGDPGSIYASRSFPMDRVSFLFIDGDESVWLGFAEARSEAGRYVATRVVRLETRHRFPWEGTQYQGSLGECAGTATYENDAWTFAFTDAACSVANGRCLRHPASP